MATLEEELERENRRIEDLRHRAGRRLAECVKEAEAIQAKGRETAGAGDAKGAAEAERRIQKVRGRARHYEDLVRELETGGNRLAAEVLLARLSGPEVDLLVGEVERNRELVVQRASALLRARDRHRALRHRWTELSEKIRSLRQSRGLPDTRTFPVEFQIKVTPANFAQQPDGPTYREVSEIVHHLGL